MSYFNNVTTILKAIDINDTEAIVALLDDAYVENEVEDLARSFLYVLISLQAGMSQIARKEFREKLTDGVVNEEIADLNWRES